MQRIVLALALLALASCGPVPRPPPVPDRTAEFTRTCTAIWLDELGRGIDPPALASCVGRAQLGETGDQIRQSVHDTPEAVAHREALSHPPVPTLSDAGERGRVHVDGLVFRREDGSIFPWRGFSDFRLFERFLAGDDIDALLTERIELGATVLRVFGMYDGGIGHLVPSARGDYYDQLGAFVDRLAARGLRVEFVVFADTPAVMPASEQTPHALRIRDVLARKTNVFVEACNEPFKNMDGGAARCDELGTALRGHGFPVAVGDYAVDASGHLFVLDYVTLHTDRKPDWPRTAKDVFEIREGFGLFPGSQTPVVADEPTGAAEVADGDRRSSTPADFAWYAATAALEGAGATFHSSSGIQSTSLGPVQRACAQAFFDALRWVPAEAQLWPYQRGDQASDTGIGEMPIRHDDGIELRSFCKGDGAREYCVQIRTGRAQATPRDGWRILAAPRRGFVELGR